MEKFGLDLDEESVNGLEQTTNPHEARKQSIQRVIKSLQHACLCKEEQCDQPMCLKLKEFMIHMNNCKRKTNTVCMICKELMGLYCYHAKQCDEAKCQIPFCKHIKQKLQQQQLVQRQKQEETMLRHVAFMNNNEDAQSESSQEDGTT